MARSLSTGSRTRRAEDREDETPSRESIERYLAAAARLAEVKAPRDYGPRGRRGPRGRNSAQRYR